MTEMRSYGGALEPVGERECAGIASTSQRGRDGHVVIPSGIDTGNFELYPVILLNHDVNTPVATCTALSIRGAGTSDESLLCRIQFPPEGASPAADQTLALVKAAVLRGLSIGFDPDPDQTEPLDSRNPRGGQLIRKAELLEISVVPIPADAGARITERSMPSVALLRGLPGRTISQAAMQRSLRKIEQARREPILNPTMHTWALMQARERDFAQRQAELAELHERGRALGIPENGSRSTSYASHS